MLLIKRSLERFGRTEVPHGSWFHVPDCSKPLVGILWSISDGLILQLQGTYGMDWTAFTVSCGHAPRSQHSFSGREWEPGGASSLQSPESSWQRGVGGGSSSLVITEVMVIFYDGTREAGVFFKPLCVLTRERIPVVLNFKDHFQSLGRPWLRQHLKLGEFLLPYC